MTTETKILELIKNDGSATADREGVTPLFRLANNISTDNSNENREEILDQILGIELDHLNLKELNLLISFIYYSKLDTTPIVKYFTNQKSSIFQSRSEEDVFRRGTLIRFILERDPGAITSREMLEEKNLRKQATWIWIDCISFQNYLLAFDEISRILSREGNFRNLLVRLPTYLKRFGNTILTDALKSWYPNLKNSEDRILMEKWAYKLNIKMGISIPAESLLDNVPFYQKKLIDEPVS